MKGIDGDDDDDGIAYVSTYALELYVATTVGLTSDAHSALRSLLVCLDT